MGGGAVSWDVRDDVWLAPIEAPAESPVFDELDARVIGSLAGPSRDQSRVPPPPPSAAFEPSPEPTSYESGRFMAATESEPEAEPEPAGLVLPNLARPIQPEVAPPSPAAPPPQPADAPSEPVQDDEPAFVIPSLRRLDGSSPAPTPEPEPDEPSVFIPSLRRAESPAPPEPAPVVAERLDVELVAPHDDVEEVHEVEEIVESPVRTGETVVGPAPTGPALGISSPVAARSVADSVYDDDDEAANPIVGEEASPELMERVDSAELELVPEDDEAPDEPYDEAEMVPGWSAQDVARARSGTVDEDDEPQQGFVIPSMSAPVGGITPAEIVLPLLARAEPEPADADDDERVVQSPSEGTDEEHLESHELEEAEVEEYEVEDPPSRPAPPMIVEEDAPEVRPPTPPPNTAERRRKAWYDDVFAEHYQFLYPPSWEETARRDAEFIHASLGLPEGSSLLDVGCGDGRHALELGKLGLRVTGLDNSLALLLAAAQHKEQMGIDDRVSFLHGDMRRLPRDRQFDAVICVGSTLGYFEEDQNRLCLDEMLDRLTPTGRLLLHVFNRDFVAPQLPARSWWQGRRCMVLDEAEMNFFANRLRVHRTIIFDDGRQFEHYMFMRAFTVHDLGKTLSQMGMRVVEVSGSRDTRKRFYGAGSPDIWIVAERKT
jgi:SAM-dependent methyltransferase